MMGAVLLRMAPIRAFDDDELRYQEIHSFPKLAHLEGHSGTPEGVR
jgi:hypothetical protein